MTKNTKRTFSYYEKISHALALMLKNGQI